MVIRSPASPYYSPRIGPHSLLQQQQDDNSNSTSLGNLSILTAAFLAVTATGGPTYSFGVYAAALKDTLQLSQSELDTLGSASFAAGLVSWIPGLFVDNWGSQTALLWGGGIQTLAFWCYWMVARYAHAWIPPSFWIPTLCALSVIIFTANNLVISGVFKSIVVSCGLGTKGRAVGAGKAYIGLGAGIFASLFHSLPWVSSDLDFLLLSATMTCLFIMVPAYTALPTLAELNKWGTRDDSTPRHYTFLYVGLAVLALVVVGTSAMAIFEPLPSSDDDDGENDDDNADDTDHDDEGGGGGFSFAIVPDWMHGMLILALWVGPIVTLSCIPTAAQQKQKQREKRHSSARLKVRKSMEDDEELLVNKTATASKANNKGRAIKAKTTTSTAATKTIIGATFIPPANERSRLVDTSSSHPNLAMYNNTSASSGATAPLVAGAKMGQLLPPPKPPQPPSPDDVTESEADEVVELICETPQPVPDLNLTEMIRTTRMWIFLLSCTILVGAGTMLTINMGQMVQSLGLPPKAAAASLAVFSVAQAAARVASGAVSESALQWKTRFFFGIAGVPRTAFLVLSCAFAVVGHGVLAWAGANRSGFVAGIIFMGFSYGALWPLIVLIVGDLFGTLHHGANYMFFDGFCCAVGTLSIAKFLTQHVYEQHVEEQEAGQDLDGTIATTTCYGEECFRFTHIVIASLCFASLLGSIVLLYITRSSYGRPT